MHGIEKTPNTLEDDKKRIFFSVKSKITFQGFKASDQVTQCIVVYRKSAVNDAQQHDYPHVYWMPF